MSRRGPACGGRQVPGPALATLSHSPFFGEGWFDERKLDRERCLAVRDSERTRLYSRPDRDITDRFPEIAEAVEQPGSTIGTGFTRKVLRDLAACLTRLEVEESPCTRGRPPRAGVLGRVGPAQHDVRSVRRRLSQRRDPWAGVRRHAQDLAKARERLTRRAG